MTILIRVFGRRSRGKTKYRIANNILPSIAMVRGTHHTLNNTINNMTCFNMTRSVMIETDYCVLPLDSPEHTVCSLQRVTAR